MSTPAPAIPTILFGAFDRHNLGDLLFPHIAARLLDERRLLFAGLVERDLRSMGGHHTRSISWLARVLAGQPLNLIHVGGELLTCDAWQAAVMVQPCEQVQPLIQQLEQDDKKRSRWLHELLGNSGRAPYTVPRALISQAKNLLYTAVGGVELKERDGAFRSEVFAKLKDADYLSVRDQCTWTYLDGQGIPCRLVPDPAVMVAELFGELIEQHAVYREVAEVRSDFSHGYVACQFSADFGDDASLRRIAAQLDQLADINSQGVVLFRAGAAPWHDDLECYHRLTGYLRRARARIFYSLNIWDICALIAHSGAFCGSSLHGRIIAMAYGLPRININHPQQASRSEKQAAYAATWELPGFPATVDVTGIVAGMAQAMAYDANELRMHSVALAARYREEFATVRALLDNPMNQV